MRSRSLPTLLALALVCACAAAPATSEGSTTGSASNAGNTAETTAPATTEAPGSTSTDSASNSSPTSTNNNAKFDLGPMPDIGNETGPVDESTCELAAMNLTSAGCLFAPTVGDSATGLPWAVVAANTSGNVDANVTLFGAAGEVLEAAVVAPKQLHTFIRGMLDAAAEQGLIGMTALEA